MFNQRPFHFSPQNYHPNFRYQNIMPYQQTPFYNNNFNRRQINPLMPNQNQIFPNYNTNFKKPNFDWNSLLNSTQKTLNVVNQAIPVFNQIKPIWNNAKTMLKVFNEFSKVNSTTTAAATSETTAQIAKGTITNPPKFFQ
ncbi:MAG: hypothetical protein ACOXZR_03635 [Bacilli bacterium]|jgi:hypothetical protein